jgi:hypothetical protein
VKKVVRRDGLLSQPTYHVTIELLYLSLVAGVCPAPPCPLNLSKIMDIISKQFCLPHVHLLSWQSARLVVALGKMAGSHAEYVRDGEPFSKGGQPSAAS